MTAAHLMPDRHARGFIQHSQWGTRVSFPRQEFPQGGRETRKTGSATPPGREGLEGGKPREPMLTSTRKETIIQSALHHTFKTHPGVLPPRQALEGSSADTPGQARNGANRNAGVQDVRGEPGFGQRHGGSFGHPASGASRTAANAALRSFSVGGATRPRGRRLRLPVPSLCNNKRRAFISGIAAGVSSAKIR